MNLKENLTAPDGFLTGYLTGCLSKNPYKMRVLTG